jgi:raffinose/stachyose/melibiose transport system substrate-binding protein
MKRKLLAVGLAVLAVALALTGCAPKATKLQVILNQTWNKPSFEPALRAYEQAHKGVTIDLQVVPDEQFTSLIKTRIATKEYPDVYLDNFGQIVQMYNVPDLLVDLSKEPWIGRLMATDGVTVGGKVYGLPMNGTPSVEGFVYNKDVFAKAGVSVPTTQAELLDACAKLKQAGVTPIVVTAKDTWTIGMWIIEIMPLVVMDRPTIWTDLNTGKVKYNEVPQFLTALKSMKQLIVDSGYVNKDFLATTYDMGNDMVATGKAAMVVQGDWAASDMVKKYPDANVGMFPFPIVDNARFTAGFTPAFTILKASKNVAAAKELLKYFATPEQVKAVALDWGYVPATKDVTVKLAPWIQEVVDNYITKGKSPIPEMGVTSIISIGKLSDYATNMVAGSMTPEEAMAEWQKYFEEQATIRKLPGW